jgi:hypothetical protein
MQSKKSKKAVRRRPVSQESLINSILYIRARNKYLQEEGILVEIGPRRWRLNFKFEK